MKISLTALSFLSALIVTTFAADESIWVEGENAAKKDTHPHNWYDSVKKDLLSGGAWLSNYGAPGGAEYEVDAAAAGDYTIWARLNHVASTPSWKLDGGEWAKVMTGDVRQAQNIAGDGKIDHRFIGWVKVGAVKLAKGKHTIAFRWEGGAANSGGLDCFCLTTAAGWVPQGTMKPGAQAVAQAPAGPGEWFPLLADEDPFDPRSVIDMSALVPAPAGKLGFLKAAGDRLQFEKSSTPQKFWGAGANAEPGKYSREQMAKRAKYLRKFGINAVRQHPLFEEVTSGGKLDAKKLDEYDWWFAELKKNGIYSAWSVFYHFTIGPEDGYPAELFAELEGKGERKDTYGIIVASPRLWEIRNKWLAMILDHKNPYTGLRYADDPALMTVEMNNEDSIFFHNPLGWLAEGKRMPLHSKGLRAQFAKWVKVKYKTDDALTAAWGKLKNGDSVNAAELNLMGAWELAGAGPTGPFAGQPKRAGDYILWLAEMQRANFETCEKVIRGTGFKAVTITTGWQVGGAASDAANIWTDTVGGMIDRHNYAGGGAGGHGIAEGKVSNDSHLSKPGGGIFSMTMKQVANKPFSVTEWTQSPPNQWKAECAPIFAFYGMGLQGWDASWHFTQDGTRLGDGWPRMNSYVTDTPHYIGQFPALALALYRGHVREAGDAALRRVGTKDVFSGTDPLKQDATKGGYDAKTLIVEGGAPLELFAVGRVLVDFAEGAARKSDADDVLKYWSRENKVARSMTNELTWDYGRERILIATPKTQAIIGKPGADTIALPGVTATVKTPFVSLIFSPLDDTPLAQSKRILITALAQDKQTGTRYSADGKTLEATGTPPLLLEPVQATLRFAGAKPASVTPCDHYGVPMKTAVPIAGDGAFQIDGTYRAYYYEVKRP